MIPYSLVANLSTTISGIVITRLGTYRAVIWGSWAIMTFGWGLMTTLDDRSHA
jgi:hypothetical protein